MAWLKKVSIAASSREPIERRVAFLPVCVVSEYFYVVGMGTLPLTVFDRTSGKMRLDLNDGSLFPTTYGGRRLLPFRK